jgi:hypothetical protein
MAEILGQDAKDYFEFVKTAPNNYSLEELINEYLSQ